MYGKLLQAILLGISVILATSQSSEEDIRVINLNIESRIQSRFAITHVLSEIQNTATEAKEVSFQAQLPAEAFISNFTMLINGRLEVGEVKEKEEAKKDYEKAKSEGQTAGLVEQKPRETDLFKTSVNVAPGGKVIFELTYQEVLKRVHGVYKHVINVLSGQEPENLQIDVYITERGRIKQVHVPAFGPKIGEKTNKELLALPVNDEAEIRESVSDGFATAHISFQPENRTTGQLAVLYDLERASNGGDIEVVDGYIVHFFAPLRDSASAPGATNLVFVLDRSGSMSGRKFTQLKEAMRTILADLKPEDRFSIVWFSSDTQTWDTSLRPATTNNVQEALQFINNSQSTGSTNIHKALIEGLKILQQDQANESPDMILFLTDGLPTEGEVQDSDGILKAVKARNKKAEVKIHNLAFGNDADYKMLQRMSKENNGLARKIYEASDAKFQLEGFYSEIANPLFTKLKIRYLDGKVDVGSIVKNRDDDTFYDGSEVMVVAKLNDPSTTTVRGEVQAKGPEGETVEFRCGNECFGCCQSGVCPGWCRGWWPCIMPPPPTPAPTALPPNTLRGFVERMWGYMTIKKLLKEADLEGDTAEGKVKKDRALRLSLHYNFVTELTSMVIVDKETDLAAFDDTADQDAPSGVYAAAHRGFHAPAPGLFGGTALSGLPGMPAPPMSQPQPRPPVLQTTQLPAATQAATTTQIPSTCQLNLLIITDGRSSSAVPHRRLVDLLNSMRQLRPPITANVAIVELHDNSSIVPRVLQDFTNFRMVTAIPTAASPTAPGFLSLMNRFPTQNAGRWVILIMSGSAPLPDAVARRIRRAKKRRVEVYSHVSVSDFSHNLQKHLVGLSGQQNFLYAAGPEYLANAVKC